MKSKTVYICSQCGARSPKWLGRCTSCGAWDSFTEEKLQKTPTGIKLRKNDQAKIHKLSDIEYDEDSRIKTGISELDRVLGGGIVPGSLVLVGGDPGIGKSTLLLQMCGILSESKPLYVTGEESLQQIKQRSQRLEHINQNLEILAETNIEEIENAIRTSECNVAVVDSIQSTFTEKADSTPGSIIQVRECASLLMQTAKSTGKAIFIIGHVTKEGIIAGPKILEHMVDTVLQFEGEKTYSFRILRSIKNRFGSTNELGIFEMGENGLEQVSNPSEIFLGNHDRDQSGVAVVAAIEGTRPILLEAQALVTPTGYSVPQRTSNGYDIRRLQMLLAVLEKRLGEKFSKHDVFVNIAGGVSMNDPSVDLGVAAALVSSLHDRPVKIGTVLTGEVGLTGEVRAVTMIEKKIREAEKMGLKRMIVPAASIKKDTIQFDIQIIKVERISLALKEILE
jgi:DNA repair protein RadA/Sms